MNSGRTYFSFVLIAFYLFFPGNGLGYVNHLFHDNGLPEIECLCCSETKEHTEQPSGGHGDDSGMQDSGCACASHIPLEQCTPVHTLDVSRLPLFEKMQFPPHMYYPIFVPPRNLAA